MATQKQLAAHLDISDRQVRELISRGVLPQPVNRAHDLDKARAAYVRHLRGVAAGHAALGPDETLDLVAERARLTKLQADGQEMKNDVERGLLLPREDVVSALQSTFARVRARLLTIPTRAASDVILMENAAEAQALLTDHVHEALDELSQTVIVSITPEDVGNPEDITGEKGSKKKGGKGPGKVPPPAGKPGGGGRGKRRAPGVRTTAKTDGKRVGGQKPGAEPRRQRRARKVADKQG